jgi:hypothetical protein
VNPIVCLEQVVLQLPDGRAHTELNCGKLKWMTNHCILSWPINFDLSNVSVPPILVV